MANSRTTVAIPTIAFATLSAAGLWLMRVQPSIEGIPVGFDVNVFEKKLLREDVPLKTQYTGVLPVDAMLSMLVAAFVPGTAGWLPALRLIQIYFLVQFFPVCCLMLAEAHRAQNQGQLVSFAALFVALYQTVGGAVILPLYYAAFVWASRKDGYYASGRGVAKVNLLLPALVLGYVVPTALMFFPWGDIVMSQDFAAFWQPAPLYPNILVYLFSLGGRRSSPTSKADITHLRRLYVVAGLLSMAAHLGLIYTSMTPSNPAVSLSTVLLPSEKTWMKDMAHGLLWIFQWDFLGTFLSTLLWSWLSIVEIRRISGEHSTRALGAIISIALLTLLGGPGAALSAVLFWRESKIASLGQRTKVM